MKKIIVALTVLGLLLVPLYAVQAQTNGETVRISLYNSGPVYVNANNYIVLHHGWMACTKGLVKAYQGAVYTETYINDDLIVLSEDEYNQYWMPINHYEGDLVQYCIAGNQRTASFVYWEYPLGTLTTGEYEIHFEIGFDHPFIDGGDLDGDGRIDKYDGFWTERTFTIYVSE